MSPDLREPGLLTNPVSALRARLRTIALAIGDTRQHVIASRAELSAQIEDVQVDLRRSTQAEEGNKRLLVPLDAQLRAIAVAVGDTRQQALASREGLAERIEELKAELRRSTEAGQVGQSLLVALDARLDRLESERDARAERDSRSVEILQALCDREPWQRERLSALRSSETYLIPFTESDPLVSVVIPTFDSYALLRERAIPSILAQTYQHFEVIVVGDAAPEEARSAVESFADDRIRYCNLDYRGPYPTDPLGQWRVAGVSPYNEAVRLCTGRWIAPLDDDDAFCPEHIERLLEAAQRERGELVYGKILQRHARGTSELLGRFPPEHGQFGLQAAIYHAGLADIFGLELTDWLFELPYDWGLCRRMLRAGVRMHMVDETSVEYFPSQRGVLANAGARDPVSESWRAQGSVAASESGIAPEDGVVPDAVAPEWEFVPQGWEVARDAQQPSSRGWDVEEVAQAYLQHWPAFCAAIADAQPFAVTHELPTDAKMSNTSLEAHNAALTLAYVLARTANGAGALSVLDWGGALGHQHLIARSALPEIQFDWHVRELPAVCRAGRRASPATIFHEDDSCLTRSYDLVLASSSFQYAEDWRAHLRRLVSATSNSLLITRLPLVQSAPSFVVIQRAQGYGYATEYLGWVFNRGELLEEAAATGLELEREFFLLGPMDVAGAPERPAHGAFLFKRSPA